MLQNFGYMSALAPIRIAANFPLKIVGKTRFSTAHVLVTKEKSPLKYTWILSYIETSF